MEEEWNAVVADGNMDDNEEDEMSNLLPLEEPTACYLPSLIRFRSFSETTENNTTRELIWRTASPNSFWVHKRRRLDDAPGCEGDGVVRPLLCVLHDATDVAYRRLETLRWFDNPRSAEEIISRFALDRRLGVTPSLAAMHRALGRLKQLRRTEIIADLVEDIVMDAPVLSVWTLLKIVEGLKGEPQRTACILFSLTPLVKTGTVPITVWVSLCCELDKLARQTPAPLERSLVELFGKVFYRIRNEGPVNGSIVVYYGQVLLKSHVPIRSITELVQTELLSGRNTPPTDAASELRLGAFLSDLIEVICTSSSDTIDEREEGLPLSTGEKLLYCSDLIKYAYAGRLRLTQSAFDAFMRFCDEERDYHRLCILFPAMCALCTPTLLSTTRVSEVLCDVEELSNYFAGVLRRPVSLLMLYTIVRYGRSGLFPVNNHKKGDTTETLERHFCKCVARLTARDGDAFVCMDIFCALVEFGTSAGAQAFICELSAAIFSPQSSLAGCSMKMKATVFGSFNLETLYYALCPTTVTLEEFRALHQTRPLTSLFLPRDGGGLTLESALSSLFASPKVYGTIMDVSAVCALAESTALAEMFVKMMDGYASKTGAFALVNFDVCIASQLTEDARQLLVTWLARHSWLILLPLSIAVQLAMIDNTTTTSTTSATSAATVSTSIPMQPYLQSQPHRSGVSLFHAVRRVGHSKVVFLTGALRVAEEVKAEGVHPAITLAELKERLAPC